MPEMLTGKLNRVLWVCAIAAGFAVALLVRWQSRHHGLIYPDGYQYLLMAKGIGSHLSPTIQLGPGGELFAPSTDAALKPLFPALTALFSFVAGVRPAADALTAAAAAATVLLAGLLAGRLTGSRAAGAVAALAALASPALGYWSGFTGPDTLAPALALATALALTSERAGLAGLLGALCVASRPEWLIVLGSGAVAALVVPNGRRHAQRALFTGALALSFVLALVRPPLAVPAGGIALLLGALAFGAAVQLAGAWAGGGRARALCAVAVGLGAILAAAVSGRVPALAALLRDEWPLMALAAIGLVRACCSGRARPALMLLAAVLLLGATYAYRNAGSERYLSQLIPLACVGAGLAIAPAARRQRGRRLAVAVAAAVVAVVLTSVLAAPRPRLATDTFASLAHGLAGIRSGTLISAAPDAYGFLLPRRAQQTLRPGARGLILLDGAQRAYAPDLSARGVIVGKLAAPQGFERPDGTVDMGPAVVLLGVVTRTTTTG